MVQYAVLQEGPWPTREMASNGIMFIAPPEGFWVEALVPYSDLCSFNYSSLPKLHCHTCPTGNAAEGHMNRYALYQLDRCYTYACMHAARAAHWPGGCSAATCVKVAKAHIHLVNALSTLSIVFHINPLPSIASLA